MGGLRCDQAIDVEEITSKKKKRTSHMGYTRGA